MDHAQAMEKLSPPLAPLVWTLAGLTDVLWWGSTKYL